MRPFEAARAATAEIGLAVLATTLQPGGDLRPGLVHVEHLRAVPLPVRHHRGGGGAGQPAGLLHADADDERPAAARGGRRVIAAADIRRPRSRGGFYAHDRPRLHAAAALARCAHRLAVADLRSAGHRLVGPALQAGASRSIIPSDVDEAEFEVNVTAPEGHEPGGDGRGDAVPIEAELRAGPGVRHGAGAPPAAASWAASITATSYVRIAPHEERVFSVARLRIGCLQPATQSPPSAATTPSAT